MNTLKLRKLGQIAEADVSFGDLTVFVGQQASGKSIALQFLKLMLDMGAVQRELRRYGLDWSGKLPEFLDVYFGEGMRTIWTPGRSAAAWKGKQVDLEKLMRRQQAGKTESMFFIPAQRVLALRDGWPRNFSDYKAGDPFAVREFSEKLRLLIEKEFSAALDLFPGERRLKQDFEEMLDHEVFGGFNLSVDKSQVQKRLMLRSPEESLPFMVWSAGQREFIPLLLGLYWLMPPGRVATREDIKWVVLEELEMGLHSRAISVVLLMVFDLVARGYRVCISTHSPQVLEAVWALRHLKKNKATAQSVLSVFGAPDTPAMIRLAKRMMDIDIKVFYFDRVAARTRDISHLDPSSEENGESGWGGLAEFSGRANDAVATAVANAGRGGRS